MFTIAFLIGGIPRFVVAACSDTVAPLAVTMAVEGVAFGIINPILTTVMYEIVPERLRSRVLSATTASVLTITPLGGLTMRLPRGLDGLVHHDVGDRRCVSPRHSRPDDLPLVEADGPSRPLRGRVEEPDTA